MKRYQILLTNDDGYNSPGLWAAADALSQLGDLWITAPRDQFTGAGRCYFRGTDNIIEERESRIPNRGIRAFAVGASPAQTIFHAIAEIMPTRPDLVVSGINYGENVGNIVTGSGTVGATIEAASEGLPAMAASLEIDPALGYLNHSDQVDFSAASFFVKKFAASLLEKGLPAGSDILKIDVPANATSATEWKLTRVSRINQMKRSIQRSSWSESAPVLWAPEYPWERVEKDSDFYAVCKEGLVSVCPMTIDLSARTDFQEWMERLK